MGRQHGVTAEQLTRLQDYETADCFDETERLALRYAAAMTETPFDVPDALFAALRAAFTPAQLVELTSAIAWENYRARFNHAFGLESQGFTEGDACAIPVRA